MTDEPNAYKLRCQSSSFVFHATMSFSPFIQKFSPYCIAAMTSNRNTSVLAPLNHTDVASQVNLINAPPRLSSLLSLVSLSAPLLLFSASWRVCIFPITCAVHTPAADPANCRASLPTISKPGRVVPRSSVNALHRRSLPDF